MCVTLAQNHYFFLHSAICITYFAHFRRLRTCSGIVIWSFLDSKRQRFDSFSTHKGHGFPLHKFPSCTRPILERIHKVRRGPFCAWQWIVPRILTPTNFTREGCVHLFHTLTQASSTRKFVAQKLILLPTLEGSQLANSLHRTCHKLCVRLESIYESYTGFPFVRLKPSYLIHKSIYIYIYIWALLDVIKDNLQT